MQLSEPIPYRSNFRQILKSASGSADSSGFGSLPTSPSDQRTKSLSRRVGIATNPKYLQGPKIIQRATT